MWVGVVLLSVTLFGLAVYALWRERQYWYQQYCALLAETRNREAALFDQLLKRNGVKPLAQPVVEPVRVTVPEVDYTDYDDRLREREEAGLLSGQQREYLMSEAREKQWSQAELELALWQKPQVDGSSYEDF